MNTFVSGSLARHTILDIQIAACLCSLLCFLLNGLVFCCVDTPLFHLCTYLRMDTSILSLLGLL